MHAGMVFLTAVWLIGVILSFKFCIWKRSNYSRMIGGICLFFITVIFLFGLYVNGIALKWSEEDNGEKKMLEYAIQNDFEVYLNGREVDVNTVDIEQYEITVDMKKEAVFMAYKQDDGNTAVIPFIVP